MKKCITDFDFRNKRVIIRCDLNVPIKDGEIMDDTRIKSSVESISYVINNGGSAIILSHLGKVKTEEDKISHSLKPVSERLSELLGIDVLFCPETRGEMLSNMVRNLLNGQVLLVENTRFEDVDSKRESSCDMDLASYWAGLGDIFINDAYGTCHRNHASNVGISNFLPSGVGFLVLREISKLDEIMNEDTHPFVVVMGGAKVSDKIYVISNLINKCDKLLIGGAMAYTFISAMGYSVGNSLVDKEGLEFCRDIINKYKDKIVLPVDCLCSISTTSEEFRLSSIFEIKDEEMGLDIGDNTIIKFCEVLKDAKRVIINGPMGMFEDSRYANGTKKIYNYIVSNNIKTLIGGGDSASSVNKLSDPSKFYHISTGGGATLEYLEGKILPGIGVIDDK